MVEGDLLAHAVDGLAEGLGLVGGRRRKVAEKCRQPTSKAEKFINHHVRVAGVKKQLFEPAAITAIHQGTAGGLRRANQLASGGRMAAAVEKRDSVSAVHIRAAASELI